MLVILHLYFIKYAGFKVYKQNVIVHVIFNTNIGTNQCKHRPFLLFLHDNSINIHGLKIYK